MEKSVEKEETDKEDCKSCSVANCRACAIVKGECECRACTIARFLEDDSYGGWF